MRVMLTGRSHVAADRFIPRFDLLIPNGGGGIEADLSIEQVAWLESDHNVGVQRVDVVDSVDSVDGVDAGRSAEGASVSSYEQRSENAGAAVPTARRSRRR